MLKNGITAEERKKWPTHQSRSPMLSANGARPPASMASRFLPGDLHQILEAGLHAPSGYNMQPWRFIVVQHPEQRRRLRAASYNQAKVVEEASAVIVACGRPGRLASRPPMKCCAWAALPACPRATPRRLRDQRPKAAYLSSFSHDQMSRVAQQAGYGGGHVDDAHGRGARL